MEFKTYGPKHYRLELTRRNLEALLEKLDDPFSARALTKTGTDEEFIVVVSVEDNVHYSDRAPGVIFMPSSGEYR